MNVLSLFSGIGGIDLGLEAHGCKTTAYSEIDPYASKIMAKRFPDAVNLGDITTIDWSEAHERFGGFDIICGGFPCQDISLAGKGAGIAEGTRSGLWKFYADAIRELRPRGMFVENVAAILGRGLDRVLGDLAQSGYDAEWDCIPAASVGAPHLRDRVFIIAYGTNTHEQEGDGSDSDCRRFQVGEECFGDSSQDSSHRHSCGKNADGLRGSDKRRENTGRGFGAASGHGSNSERERGERRGETSDLVSASGASEANSEQWERDGDATINLRATVTNSGSSRREGRDSTTEPMGTQVPIDQRSRSQVGWAEPIGSDYWLAEPGVGRMVDGLPNRVDRLRCLGNAVVPQVAEHVAGILMERLRETR